MDWRQRVKESPYMAVSAVCAFIAAGLMFASISTHSDDLRLSAGGFIAASIVASCLALFGPGGLYRR
jgi:hypothetical protein